MSTVSSNLERLPDNFNAQSTALRSDCDGRNFPPFVDTSESYSSIKSLDDEEGLLIGTKGKVISEYPISIYKEKESSVSGRAVRDKSTALWTFLTEPYSWLTMLSRELNASFVFGIMVVYGASQGLGGALGKVVVDYYWKDVQHSQPSHVQFYSGITFIPWDIKPLWGLITDTLPIAGYHRRPYFIISGLLSLGSCLLLVLGGKLYVGVAVTMFTIGATCTALSDATIDAEVARKSREKPALGSDIQTLCAYSGSVGGLIGYCLSGLSVDALGAQGALGLFSIPAVLLFLLGFILHEPCVPDHLRHYSNLGKEINSVTRNLWTTLKHPCVWKPTLFMYLSWALSPDISEGKFYWYADSNVGPGFSQGFVGVIFAMGSIGALIGAIIYQKRLKTVSFRSFLMWIQILVAASGMLDLVFVTRLNRKLHIPDNLFAVGDESVTQAIVRIKWMPLLVLAAKLCPPGIEGTFFAFLMSVDNVGMLTATWGGSVLLHFTKITRTDFKLLWLAVLIRNLLRLLPIAFVFLVPSTDSEQDLLPPELTTPEEDKEDLQLVEVGMQNF